MRAASLPLQSSASRAAFRPKEGACEAAAQDPEAPLAGASADPFRARHGLVRVRAGDRDRERHPLARPRPAPEPRGRRIHLRGPPEPPRARRPARVGEPDHRAARQDLGANEAVDRRDRGQALLRAPRRRPPRDRARRLGGPPQQEGRRGRLDDHAAVRQEHVPPEPALDRQEAEGGGAGLAARAALVEGPDPDGLPEHDLLRERRVRDRTGSADLLRPQGRPHDLGRSGTARRDPERPLAVRPGHEPQGGAGPARDRARARSTTRATSPCRSSGSRTSGRFRGPRTSTSPASRARRPTSPTT